MVLVFKGSIPALLLFLPVRPGFKRLVCWNACCTLNLICPPPPPFITKLTVVRNRCTNEVQLWSELSRTKLNKPIQLNLVYYILYYIMPILFYFIILKFSLFFFLYFLFFRYSFFNCVSHRSSRNFSHSCQTKPASVPLDPLNEVPQSD